MIREINVADIKGLNSLPPKSWKIDYEAFLKDFLKDDFFYAFIQIQDNKVVGTGNVLIKENIGWLGNIIVDENHRGKGLGYEMTKFLVDFLTRKKCDTQLLIATELGEPIYRKIGFKKLTEYQSFDSEEGIDYSPVPSIRKLEQADLESVYRLDRYVNAENRSHLIDKYYKNGFGYFNRNKELLGFYLPEFGRGLVLSQDEEAGIELLKLKHTQKGKRTLTPIENQAGITLLENSGLKKGDKSSKMVLGKENKWIPENIYSYGSGYCG